MATDSTNLPQGETTLDAGMTGSDLDHTTVQEAANEPAKYVDLPKGNTVILLPVQPGQTVRLPTDSTDGVLAKIGPEGNLALVIDGRTIILQGFLKANDQSPIKIVTNDGDAVNVAELVAATDPSLDIQTAAGPASGDQGDTDGSGIYIPFLAGPGLGGILAEGILDPTALQYRLIDDEYREFVLDEDGKPLSIDIVPDEGRPTAEDGAFLLDEDFQPEGNQDLPAPSLGDDAGSNDSSGTVVVNFGSDGPRAVDPIVMTGVVNGSPSGLFALTPGSTAQGAPILLQLDPPAGGFQVLTGYVGGTEYFTITLNTTTGHFVVEQLEPLWHPVQGTEDNVLFEIDFTAFDANGDSLTATLDLSFDDDSPEIVLGEGSLKLAMDESFSINFKDYDDPNFANDGVKDGSVVEADALVHALDTFFAGLGFPPFTIGAAKGNAAGLFAVNYGADGPNDVSYALTVLGAGATGLTDTATQTAITLVQNGNVVEGRDGLNNLVFALAIDPDTGDIVSAQYRAIDHGDEEGAPGAHDEVAFLAGGAIGVTATAVDGDGDSKSHTIDIGGSISFDDDGPKFIKTFFDGDSTFFLNGVGTIDEDALKGGISGGPGDDSGGKSVDGQVFFDFGSDGFGSLAIDSLNITDATGATIATIDGNGDFTFGSLKTADGRDIDVNVSVGAGGVITYQGVAVPGGDPVFTMTLDGEGGALGEFEFELHLPLEHPFQDADSKNDGPQTAWEDNLNFDFTVRGTDGDGDSDTGHIKIRIDDDSPKVQSGEGKLTLAMDESFSINFKDYDDPNFANDGVKDGSVVEADALVHALDTFFAGLGFPPFTIGAAKGNVAGLFSVNYGADGPGDVAYTLTVLGAGATGLTDTATQTAITLVQNGNVVEGRDGLNNLVFALAIDPDTGDIVSAQYRAIDHGDEEGVPGAHDEVAFLAGGALGVTATVTDADGDSHAKTIDIGGSVSFDDDGPKFVKVFWGFDGDGSPIINGVGQIDEDALKGGISGGPGDDSGSKSVDGQVFFDFGSDGAGHLSIDSLNITDATGATIATIDGNGDFTFGSLKTADGRDIDVNVSVGAGGVITYQGVAVPGGDPVFTLTLDGEGGNLGEFEFELHLPLEHPFQDADSKNDGPQTAWEDNLNFDFTVRGTDGDGDSDTGHIKIRIDDDSPKVLSGEGKLTLAMDESFSINFKDYDDPNFANDGVKDGSVVEADALVHALDTFFAGLGFPPFTIGAAKGNVAGLFSVNYGADGPGDVAYTLTVLGAGATGLTDTATQTAITLVQNGNVVEGRDGLNNLVFALAIDPDTGDIVSAQYRAIDHGDEEGAPGAHDEVAFLAGGALGVTATATDADGDSHAKTIDIGGSISFDDDGPKFVKVDWGHDNDSSSGVGIIDEDKLSPNGNNDNAPGDNSGGTQTDGQIVFDFGSDQPGTLAIEALTITNSLGQTVAVIDGAGNFTSGALHTADGRNVAVTVSVGGGGVITYQGVVAVGEPGAGAPVFTLTLDGAGGGIGNFNFVLHQPLEHPFTDSDSQNNGPDTAFEDNLNLDFTVRGTDGDGDSDTGHINIRIDDDSPVATCDVDCVVEGKDGETLNSATGNVVTGDGDTVFGNDANNLDGNADKPGADQPYTISKLSHGGTDYFLNTPEVGDPFVTKGAPDGEPGELPLGAGETFDPLTGILHIPTQEGGTLDIVLISDTLADVGDYKYTVPENAEHETDKHFGPETLSESLSDEFNSVSEWTTSFSDNGIALSPIGGSLELKPINVAGGGNPDYRGIGVANFPGDESEVDRGGNEGLKLDISDAKFPGGVNNISLTIGALFDGTQYDNTHQEILQWNIYNNGILVGSGQILGNNDGVVTLDIDSLVKFDRVELKPINNGQGDQQGESFGDNSDFLLINAEICCPEEKFTETFDYTLRDSDGDESTASLKIDVKDTEPTHGDGQPFITALVVDEDGLPNGVGNTDSPADNEEDHNLPNASVDDAVHFGTIPFTPGADPTSIELTVLGGPDTGMKTLDNQKIFAAWDATLNSLIGYIEGTDPNDAANQVFKMTILDPLTGEYSFELLQPVKHNNSDIFIDDNTENVLNLPANFIVVAEIEDKDCDVIFSKVLVTIDDDMPVITDCCDDENLLVNGSFEDLGKEDGGTLENGTWGVFSQIPGWKSGADEANPSGLPGLEIQNASAVGLTAQDGKYYVELDSDNLDPSDPAPSTTNASIYQDVGTVDGNNYVLSFSYSPRTGDESTDGIEVWFDGVKVATIDSGEVGEWKEYTFVVEAGAGDGTPDLSRLEFKAVGSANELGGFIDDVSLTACAIVDEDALPNGIEGGPGDDVGGACFSGSLGVNFGADGGKSIVFSESGQPALKSHGATVNYFWNDATKTLIGYTGSNAGKTDPANWVFTVEVQSLDNGGEYKFTLLKPLDHPDSNDNHADDKTDSGTGSFEDNLVFELKFKATDRDDDTVNGHLKINVDDDSPKITDGTGSISLHTDETLGGGADVLPNPGTTAENDEAGAIIPGVISAQVAGTVIGFSQGSATGLFNAQYGADGPGSPAWSLTVTGGGATGLIDTATGSAITLVAGANGVVLGKTAGGDVVFAFSIDGSGNVTMVQYRAVNHGANEDAPGNHDEAIFMNAGVLGVTLKLTDFDGDGVSYTRDISGSISIDDDGPHATCDYDSVTEGAGNIATGNVVSGANPENPDLGTDLNNTDGNADQLSQDTPHTISKLTHGGHAYTLSADGLTVLKDGLPLGAGESFAGGKLTITTEEGATFEIIMVSSDPADVGEYKYTAGPNPIHAEDVNYGADSLAESITLAQGGVAGYAASFGPGITLEAIGGTLAVKTVDVNPKGGPLGVEDYGGIGVASSQGDEAEVDQLNQGEALKLNFATPTDNAEIQLGALFNGVQYDSGFQEIVKWEALAADGVTVIASGQILGVNNGLVVLDIDTDVPFSSIKLTPLNNGAGSNGNNSDFVILGVEVCNEEPVKEEFGYTLRDGDGDESSAALKICVEDTYPRPPEGTGTLAFTVDEDGLPAGIGNSDSPNDVLATSASFAGNIPFIPGADPVTIELSIGNGGDTGLKTLAGQTVFAAWDAATSTLIGFIAGTDPSDSSNQVFKMTVTDHPTGAFTFELLKPIKHADGGQDDNTENEPDPQFLVNVQIEDKDCDVAFTTVTIGIDDDMPVIGQGSGSIALAVDESLDGNSTPNNAGDHPHNPGTRIEDDEDGAGLPGVLTGLGSAIGASKSGAAGLFTANPGADGLLSAVYSLTLTGGGPVATGLIDTQSNTLISLVAFGDGTVRGISASGHLVFALSINGGTGEVSMAQYRAINHGGEEAAPGNHDEVKVLGTGGLLVTLTVTDKDLDTVSKSVDITGSVTFDDDGPKTSFDLKHNAKIVVDESVGFDPSDSNANDEAGNILNDIGYAKVSAAALFDEDTNFGTDGAASSGSKLFTLQLNGGNGTNSGLVDAASNQPIVLVLNGNTIEGHVGNAAGALAFTISVDANTGEVTVSQKLAVEHDNSNDHDESSSPEIMDLNKVLLTLTVKDGDGDTASDTADLGKIIKFEDDGPKVDINRQHNAVLTLDETKGAKAGDSNANDEAASADANDIGYATITAGNLFSETIDFGSDGPAAANSKVFALQINGGAFSGLIDAQTNQNINLTNVGGVIEGRTSGSNELVFKVIVSATGDVTVHQYRAVEHDNSNDHDESGSPAVMFENKLLLKLTVTDGDGDSASDTIDLGKIVKFEDDGPVAVNDTDSVTEDSAEDATGNVITGVNPENAALGTDSNATDGSKDNPGSDGFLANSVQWADPDAPGGIDGNGQIVGQYGTLFVDANGEYRYVLDETDPALATLDDGEQLSENFTYFFKDGDGDKTSGTLTIKIDGHTDAFPPTAENATAFVDEDGLPAGLKDSQPGDDNADLPPDTVVGEAVFHDLTLPVSWNGNVGTISLTAGAWAGLLTIDGHAIIADPTSTSTLLRGIDAVTLQPVFEVEILNHTTGEYEVRLLKALLHPDSNNFAPDDIIDDGIGSFEDNVTIPVNVKYTNIAGEANQLININVDDDSPVITFVSGPLHTLDDEGSPLPTAGGIEGSVTPGNDVPGASDTTQFLVGAIGGADGIKEFGFNVTQTAALNTLRVTDGTADGAAVSYSLESGDLVVRVADATSPLNGQEVLRVDSNGGGLYTVTQSLPLFHSGQDEVSDIDFQIVAKVTDNDGDAVETTVTVKVDDDMPDANLAKIKVDPNGDGKLIHDETPGVNNADDVASRPASLADFETAHPGLTVIGYASTSVSVDLSNNTANANAAFGADGSGSKVLELTQANGAAFSGQQSNLLDTATGNSIFLYTEIVGGESVVVGRVGTPAANDLGAISFVLKLDESGSFDLGQYRAIKHPDTTNHDDAVTLLGFGGTSSLLHMTLTLTDGDGDTHSKTIPLNNFQQGNPAVVFEDDGPALKDGAVQGATEEDDINNAFSVGNNEDGSVGKDVAQGSLTSLVDFGTDGAATGGGFSLDPAAIATLTAQGLSSKGVALTYGIVGDTLTASAGLQTVFTLKVEPNGNYTFTLVDQLDHHPIPLADNVEGFLTINLGGVVKATDGDGDSVSLTDNFSVKVQDDIPTAFNPADKSTGNNAGAVVVGDLDFQGHVGTDEPASITFTGFTNGDAAKDVNGDPIKSQGEDVFLYGDGTGVITGKTADNDVIFTVTLNPGADTYSFNLNRAIDDGGGVVFTNLSGGKAGQKEWARIDNLDTDLLITPLDQVAGTVNTDTNDIGVADQFIDKGEGVRIDFVKSPAGDEAVQNGYTFANHYLVNETSFSIIDIGGGGTASLKLRIVKADDDTNLVTDTDAQDVVAALSAAGIKIDNNAGAAPTITDLGGGYFQIDGLDKDDTVTVTGDEAYNRLEITGLDGKQFSIGELAIGTIVSGDPVTMNFDVKLTDKDGDSTTADFNVTVVDQPPVITDLTPKAQGGDTIVDEEALSDGTNPSSNAESGTGSFKISAADGLDDLTISDGNDTITIIDDGVFQAGKSIGTSDLGNKLEITGYDSGTGVVTYKYTLNDNENHPAGNGQNSLFDDFAVKVTDKDGDFATGVLSAKIIDDVPVANALTKSILADNGQDTNLLITLDISGSMDEASGMTGLNKLQAAIASVKELIEQYDALGNVKVRIVTFSSDAQEEGGVWMTVAQARTFLNSLLDDDGSTNYDAALDAAMGAFPDTGQIPGAQNVAYFLSDGNPNQPSGDAGIDGGEEATWINFLKANDINSFALGFGQPGDVNQSAINPIAYNGVTETNTNGQVITDLNLLTAALVSTVTPPVNGNLKTDGGNKIGADNPGIVSQVTFGGNTFVFNGTTISRTTGALSFTGVGGVLVFSTPNGTLQVNMSTGAYTYALLADAAANDQFGYTLTDTDGDSATSTLQISAAVSDIAPIVRDDHIIAGHDDDGGNESIVIPAAALLWNDSDANGDAIAVSNTFSNVNNLVSVALGSGNVTITDGQDGGTFTYTGTANGKSDTGDVVVDRSQEGDNSLDGNGLDNIIVSDGSSNTLNGYEGNDVLLGNDGDDTLNGGSGRDWLVGGIGDDLAVGGAGNDLIDVSQGNDTVRYTSSLDGKDVISGFDADATGGQDVIDLNQLFDNNGNPNEGTRASRINVQTVGSDTVITIDAEGNGFGVGKDVQITVLGVTGLTVDDTNGDILYGNN